MNESSHILYMTYSTPVAPEAEPHITILDHACRWAANMQSPDPVCSAILQNGFANHYTWEADCHLLSSDFVRLVGSIGITGQQHVWESKYYFGLPLGYRHDAFPHLGSMVQQRTIASFTPVGEAEGRIEEWWWHQWAEAAGKQRDPSAAYSHPGAWGAYEDHLFTHYREVTQASTNAYQYSTQWTINQSGQGVGPEKYPDNCDYSPGLLSNWRGPDRYH